MLSQSKGIADIVEPHLKTVALDDWSIQKSEAYYDSDDTPLIIGEIQRLQKTSGSKPRFIVSPNKAINGFLRDFKSIGNTVFKKESCATRKLNTVKGIIRDHPEYQSLDMTQATEMLSYEYQLQSVLN